MASPYTQFSTRSTPQSEKIPGSNQVANSAGGFSYGIDKFSRLHRFLILGSEGGSYYAGERELTVQNAQVVQECIAEDGLRTVQIIVEISKAGRAPKNDPALFALAMASALGDLPTRRAAYDALSDVARIGTHLFQFVTFRKQFAGVSRGLRRAVSRWYLDREVGSAAYQAVKYRQREGWEHRDVLRVMHPKADSVEQNNLLRWIARKPAEGLPRIVEGFEKAQAAATPAETAALVREYRLPREALKTEHLNDNEVWQAMLDIGMPMTAMVRNLATMTRNGLLTPTSEATRIVLAQLADAETISKSRIHPIQMLMALRTYQAGRGLRGSNVWAPLPQIVDALDEAYYLAFGNLVPTGKRRLIALDISGSMWSGSVAGIPGFTPAEASGAMAMCSIVTGDPYEVVAFADGNRSYGRRYGTASVPQNIWPGLVPMTLSKRQRLDDVSKAMRDVSPYMGGTDCALPMVYAREKGKEFDVFEVYTDSETWAGVPHPSQALVQYRHASGINAKMVVVGMVSNGFSIANPADPGMLDVCGFDTATPNLISAFIEGGF